MKVLKTVCPDPHNYVRFVSHKGETFKLGYRALYDGLATKHAAVDAHTRAHILSNNGWSLIVDNYDVDVPPTPRHESHSDRDDSAARAEFIFEALQDHIGLLYSEKE